MRHIANCLTPPDAIALFGCKIESISDLNRNTDVGDKDILRRHLDSNKNNVKRGQTLLTHTLAFEAQTIARTDRTEYTLGKWWCHVMEVILQLDAAELSLAFKNKV